MAAMLDIFDQEKVWDMALKAERREGREEGFKEGFKEGFEEGFKEIWDEGRLISLIIRLCRSKSNMPDSEIIRILMQEVNLSRDEAAECLFRYDHPRSDTE